MQDIKCDTHIAVWFQCTPPQMRYLPKGHRESSFRAHHSCSLQYSGDIKAPECVGSGRKCSSRRYRLAGDVAVGARVMSPSMPLTLSGTGDKDQVRKAEAGTDYDAQMPTGNASHKHTAERSL